MKSFKTVLSERQFLERLETIAGVPYKGHIAKLKYKTGFFMKRWDKKFFIGLRLKTARGYGYYIERL